MFAATASTLAKGKGYDRELIKRMEDASGKPATTAATAFVNTLHAACAGKSHRRAWWSKTMDKAMVDFMETSGFKVVHKRGGRIRRLRIDSAASVRNKPMSSAAGRDQRHGHHHAPAATGLR